MKRIVVGEGGGVSRGVVEQMQRRVVGLMGLSLGWMAVSLMLVLAALIWREAALVAAVGVSGAAGVLSFRQMVREERVLHSVVIEMALQAYKAQRLGAGGQSKQTQEGL